MESVEKTGKKWVSAPAQAPQTNCVISWIIKAIKTDLTNEIFRRFQLNVAIASNRLSDSLKNTVPLYKKKKKKFDSSYEKQENQNEELLVVQCNVARLECRRQNLDCVRYQNGRFILINTYLNGCVVTVPI